MARRDAAEKRFLDIAAVSDDWFFELDSDLRHVYLSENFEKLLGRPAQSMLHQPLDALAPGATGSAEWAALIARLEAREPFADAMFEHERGTGERVWLRLSGTPFHDPEGTFLGYRGVGSDVTALYAERLRAIEGSAAKGRMLATMSHEIRTPLNGILGMAELLDPLLDHDGQREMLTTIRASGEILVGMLDNLLDMSKIEAGQLELVSAPLVPRDVVEKTMSLYRERARQKGIAFELKADPGAARPRLGDAHRLQQILQNLVSNAFKFTAQGHVTIRLSAPADHPVTIDVADSGIGMSPEQAETVFEAYRQADSRIASRYGGTGLGLSIVHELVAAMGGVISVDSTPGAGTRFRLTLPLCEVRDLSTPSVIGAQHLGGPAHEAALAGKRLLLADDSETNLAVLRGMLRHTGAHCVEARDGLEVVARWTEQARGRAGAPFDLLALDINMPGKTGREAMAELRTHEAALGFAPVPALAVTADVQPEQVVESIAAGFDAVLAKPFGRSNLVGVASRLVAERDVDREIEPSPPADPSNCRVLIADDDEIAREILTEFLRVADPAFEVQVATDGRAALMAGLTQTYGLMILDRNMPGIPGDRVIRALRGGRSANRDTPMVLASGETDRARFGRRDVGEADFYATKPLDMSSFVSAIRTLTGRSSAQQAATGT
ncbi:response regulator [Citreimonas sp.]|uniref:hybrid sensor histidine kinase/response regulator n=1 Tax=Citreimonas sp. TaxID=3036715 RepID=UPI0035C82EA9